MKGLITPLKVASNSNGGINPQAFSRFMMGGKENSLGSNLAGSANNIVNFSRATATPLTPNFSSILDTISSNISNYQSQVTNNIQGQIQNISQNIQGQVQNITNNINKIFSNTIQRIQVESQSVLSNAIQKFTIEYQEKIKESADNQPSNVLKSFQSLYRNTIDFVTFLGDPKTNNKITKSLISLRKMFDESLNVSTLIREAIIKIVDQLSNLPTASPNAGGLSLDVDVPGGKLKQSGGVASRSGIGRKLGMGALGLGIGAAGVGLGAAGSGMLSAKKFQEEKLQSKTEVQPKEQMIPENFIADFQKLIETFDSSITNLIEFVKRSSGERPTTTGGGGGAPPPPPNNQLQPQPANIEGNEKELLKRLMIAEASGEGVEGMAMVGRSVLNRAALIQSGAVTPGTFGAKSGSVTGVIQAPGQYTPYSGGKLNRPLSADENTRAEEAYKLIFNDPEFRRRISSKFGLSGNLVNRAAAATGFRNYNAGAGLDYSQKVREFNAGRHTFNVAGNENELTPYSSAVINQPGIPAIQSQAQPTSASPNTSQSSSTPSQVAPKPRPSSLGPTSSSTSKANVTVATLPSPPPSVVPAQNSSGGSALQSKSNDISGGTDASGVSSTNHFVGFSFLCKQNLCIVSA